jgi:hypothetical protein
MISAKEVARRARILEEKGLEVPVIGRKPQSLKVLKERSFQRLIQRLILGDTGRGIGITVSSIPQIRGRRISLALALDIPLGQRKLRLSREDKRLLQTILVQTIEKTRQLRRSPSDSRHPRHAHRAIARRASTGS